MKTFLDWFSANYIEVIAAVIGLVYIYFSIKEHIFLWIAGFVSSAFYIYVYFISKFYADMSLQFYYLAISVYGWFYWRKGSKKQEKEEVVISRTPLKTAIVLFLATVIMFFAIGVFLDTFTDSPVPYWDAFTTALSITATFMLTRKYIEQWLLWIIVDAVSVGLYIYRGLYATSVYYSVLTILAVVGFMEWRKKMIATSKDF